jgi:hypothetical protein
MRSPIGAFLGAICMSVVLTQGMAWASTPIWSNAVTIASIELDPNPGGSYQSSTYLTFTTPPTGRPGSAPTVCNTSAFVILTGPADHIKAMTTLATAAFLAGRTVKLYWDGTCTGAYANVQNISIS